MEAVKPSFRLYVSGATATLRRLAPTCADVLGYLVVPGAGNDPKTVAGLGLKIAADNGAFSGLDAKSFTLMMLEYWQAGVGLDWVVVPDVVADAKATFKLFGQWESVVKGFRFPRALVLQDGLEFDDWLCYRKSIQCVFIGGSTEFKLSEKVLKLVRDARSLNLPVHMGRVNSRKRIRYAIDIGCTSCDGSGFSKWPDTRIPMAVRWIREKLAELEQQTLFSGKV